MKNIIYLFVLLFGLASCAPDEYVKTDEVEVGYALMYSFFNPEIPDTLFCTRAVVGKDTLFYETGCVSNRLTADPYDSKDTLYRTDPWPLIRFVADPKAISRFEKCGKPK